MSSLNGLPRGWCRAVIGELVQPTRPRVAPQDYARLPFIGMEHVEAQSMRLLGTVPSETMRSSAVHFEPGDVLYGRLRPYLNKVYRAEFEGLCSAEFIVLPESGALDPKYLQYFLNSAAFVAYASHLNTGDRPRVDFDQISSHCLPIPPRAEQLRIVAEIEKQFTRLDAAVAALKRVQANLKRYRASVLKAACEGRLVPTEAELARREGRSYEPASELLKRIASSRNPVRGSRGTGTPACAPPPDAPALPEGWTSACIGDLASVGTGVTPLKSKNSYYENGTIPWITSTSLNQRFVDTARNFVTRRALDETNLSVYEPGTLLIAMYGEGKTRGKCSELRICATTNQAIAAIVLSDPFGGYKHYVRLFLDKNYEDTRKLSSGGVQPNLNLGLIRGIRVPLPPLAEQARITNEADAQLSTIENTSGEIDSALVHSSRLRQSILKRAFEGKLVPQDPNDEPASVLLDRIRASRATSSAARPGKAPGASGNHRPRKPRLEAKP